MTHLHLCFLLITIPIINEVYGNDLDQTTYNLISDQIINHLYKTNGDDSFKYQTTNLKLAQRQDKNAVDVEAVITSQCKSTADSCPRIKDLECKTTFLTPSENVYNLSEEKFVCHYITIEHQPSHCANCPTDLNTNASGISTFINTALSHLNTESNEYSLIQTLRIQRQVLETVPYGVKYFLTLEVSKHGTPQTCEITFLEKPVLENTRHVIANNCTETQEFTTLLPEDHLNEHRNDQSNEIDVNFSLNKPEKNDEPTKVVPNFEEIAQTGTVDDVIKITDPNYEAISPSKIQEIESQIIPNVNKKVVSNFGSEQRKAIDGLLDVFDFDIETPIKSNIQSHIETGQNGHSIEPLIVPVKAIVSYQQPELNQAKIEAVIIGVSDTEDPENITEDFRQKRDINYSKELQPTTSDEKELIANLSEIAVNTLDNIDTDNHKRVVLKILGSKKLVDKVAVTYHLTLKVGISECMEDMLDSVEKCRKSLLPDLTMICKVQVLISDEKSNPKVIKSQCQNLKRNGEHSNRTGGRVRRAVGMVGGPIPLDDDSTEFVNLIHASLNQLDASTGEPNRLKVTKVLKATKQLVAGVLYKITVEVGLSDLTNGEDIAYEDRKSAKLLDNPKSRVCTISSLDQPWKNTTAKVTIDCADQIPLTFRVKRGIKSMPGGNTNFEPSTPKFEEVMHHSLNQLDSNSGEPNRFYITKVIESTKQVVSGALYKITAEVGLTELSNSKDVTYEQRKGAKLLSKPKAKECKFTIWEQLWTEKKRDITIECTEQKNLRKKRFLDSFKTFQRFLNKYNKTYDTQMELKSRYEIFKENMKVWDELNDKEQGTAKYGPTIFADLTKKEFKQYLGYNPSLRSENDIPLDMAAIPDIDLPDSFDWRTKGAVSPVKNQQSCGSCWAFSVTGNVEGQYAIKTGKLQEFSEQELVDCDKLDDGCNGGLMDNAYRAIETIGGLELESDYPYDAKNEKCHIDKSKMRVQLKGGLNITQDEVGMAKWLVANGPISIAINANAMQFYMGGVSHPWKSLCNPTQLDHGVLIVGYGVSTNKYFNKTSPYWIVKNSWGRRWGEQGYYRVYRGAGTCGVNQTPSSAILAD